LSWAPHCSLDDTIEYLRQRIKANDSALANPLLIFCRDSGQLLGSVGGIEEGHRMTFGYCLARDAWGRGFATEAATVFVKFVLENPAIWRIQAFCDVENGASARVLEKAGLTLEGTLRRHLLLPNRSSAPRDVFCYAKVRELTI
jgi:RimJ/RimL family protein N-acetyltransferase